jgi:hypothetical protein
MTVTSKYANGWCLRGLGLLALLGIMVAPLCGALCAGNFCAGLDLGGPAGSAACHETTLTPGNVSQVRIHSQKSCSAPELSFAILSKAQTSLGILATNARPGIPIHAAVRLAATFVPQIAFERGLFGLTAPHPHRHPSVGSVLLI